MIFNRTYRFRTNLSISEIKERLLHQHFKVHDMDFEVSEKQQMIKVIPHAENVEGIKTLPITHIEMQGMGNGDTRVKMFTKPRKIDAGGPYMIVIFCLFCVIGASLFYLLNNTGSLLPSLVMVGVAVVIFILFWYRMEAGYFDYVRKIKHYVHGKLKENS